MTGNKFLKHKVSLFGKALMSSVMQRRRGEVLYSVTVNLPNTEQTQGEHWTQANRISVCSQVGPTQWIHHGHFETRKPQNFRV